MTTQTIDLKRLKALCELNKKVVLESEDFNDTLLLDDENDQHFAWEMGRPYREYFAHANPAMMLTLLNALETAVEALRFYENRENYNFESGALSCLQPKGLDRKMFKVLDFGNTARAALSRLAELGVG